jgi:hypothetical protein
VEGNKKEQAFEFLKALEKTLNNKLPGPAEMETWVSNKVASAKTNAKEKHLRLPEAAFLNGQAIPILFDFLKTGSGLTHEEARKALLNEYHGTMPEYACKSPTRWESHPFRKLLGARPKDIYKDWKAGKLTHSCPDFSLHDPFPHAILFEGKYFRRGSAEYAQRQLVTDTYQAFFYRGLPALAATKKYDEWSYDYACLMAYDASSSGSLVSAWTALDLKTRRSFWESAGVYVMILRGSAS